MAQSAELTEFYQVYKAWLDGDKEIPFQENTGLRGNLLIACGGDWKDPLYQKLLDEMQLSFLNEKLHVLFPFNKDQNLRNLEFVQNRAHLNVERILWVTNHLE